MTYALIKHNCAKIVFLFIGSFWVYVLYYYAPYICGVYHVADIEIYAMGVLRFGTKCRDTLTALNILR